MDVLKEVNLKIFKLINEFRKESNDHYDLYEEHIKGVMYYIDILAKGTQADKEVLTLAALMHDVSLINNNSSEGEHNELSAMYAYNQLSYLDYPEDKKKLIVKCILNHVRSKVDERKTLEEKILGEAIALTYFDNPDKFFNKVLHKDKSDEFILDELEKAYETLGVVAKKIAEPKLQKIRETYNK